VCGNLEFNVTVWRTVNLMKSSTESVKRDRFLLYNLGEHIVWGVW
jgi:hypothetical protein